MSNAMMTLPPLPETILPQRAVLKVSGSERVSFLDGLITNTLAPPSAATYAALLTPQGKIFFDLIIHQHEDALYIDCDGARADQLLQRLTMYKLRADVTLEDMRAAAVVVVGDQLQADHIQSPDPRDSQMGLRGIAGREHAAFTVGGNPEAYHQRRMMLGIAEGDSFAFEKDFWLETDAERLNGVAFDKGCYVGQELTARMKHRMDLKKTLMRFQFDGPAPETGSDIVNIDGKNAGTVRETAGNYGLAFVRLGLVDAGGLQANGTSLTLIP